MGRGDGDVESYESKAGMMATSTYIKHLILMTIMWTASGFGYFLVIFLTKQFEGNLFLNFYLDGVAGMLGYLVALPIYRCCKIRWTFVLGFGAALFWTSLLLIFQQGYADTKWIEDLGAPPCDAPDGSKEARDHDLRVIVPIIVFFLKAS
jgi:hypothetical protein